MQFELLDYKRKSIGHILAHPPCDVQLYLFLTHLIHKIYSAAPQLHLPSEDGQNIGGLQSGDTEDVAWT